MWKKWIIATVAVFVSWQILDYVIHSVILMDTYGETSELWRPMEEMKMGLMLVVTLIAAGAFCAVYAWLIAPKDLMPGVWYGLIWGVGAGISMGYGTYAVQPLPYILPLVWFLGTVVEAVVAGVIVALIVKAPVASDEAAPSAPEPAAEAGAE